MIAQVLACFRDQQLRVFVDGTLGAGGHSAAIVAEHPELQTLIGIDMDPTAHEIAKGRISIAVQNGSSLMSMETFRQVQVISVSFFCVVPRQSMLPLTYLGLIIDQAAPPTSTSCHSFKASSFT